MDPSADSWAVYKSQHLNVLNLGDHTALGLGATVERERRTPLFISVALAGACVAVGGGIAFLDWLLRIWRVSLWVPVIRNAAGLRAPARWCRQADMIGKNLMAPSEIPVGLVVSCLGAPYFIYLLIKD